MRLHRFIIDADLNQKTLAVTDSEIISQWKNVLRLEPGEGLILSDGHGLEAEAVITRLDKKVAEVDVTAVSKPAREPATVATLYCALLKRENFETVIQKATEIGIARIVPLITERTIKTGFNRERLLKIIREAAEQSGRTVLPSLAEPASFAEALSQADPSNTILLDLDGTDIGTSIKASNAFIGPEGGFSETEVAQAKEAGFRIGLMGALTMRGETAAIVASYLITR